MIDNEAPELSGPGKDEVIYCPAIPEFTPPTAIDNCGSATLIEVGLDTLVLADGSVSYTMTWYAVDKCGNESGTYGQTITRKCVTTYCSLTQGFYGNATGVVCATGERGYDLINRILGPAYGDLIIGADGRSLTISHKDGPCVIEKLPAGGKAALLPSGDNYFGADCTTGTSLDAKPKFNNVLVGQVITLGLNLRLDADLGTVQLEGTQMTTIGSLPAADEYCGTEDDVVDESSVVVRYIPHSVLLGLDSEYGGDRSISNLYLLANRMIGGEEFHDISLSQINRAVSAINEGFDECRYLDGFTNNRMFDLEREVEESNFAFEVFPNPFRDHANISFISSNDVEVRIELYNSTGALVGVVFNDVANANTMYNAQISSSELRAGMYFCRIIENGKVHQERILLNK